MIGNLSVKDRYHVLRDRPVPPMGLDDDPLEQIIRDVDGPALDPLGGACVDSLCLPRRRPPAPRRAGRLDVALVELAVGLVRLDGWRIKRRSLQQTGYP